jgi:acyl-CoA thioesterase FadM
LIRPAAQSTISHSEGWSPTIVLASPWGISVFLAGPIMTATGWIGIVSFAAANAVSLLAFGWILERSPIAPTDLLKSIRSRYTGVLLMTQILVVALALLGAAPTVVIPRFGPAALPVMALFVLFATAAGHLATMRGLKRLHAFYLGFALIAAMTVILAGPNAVQTTLAPTLGDGRGLAIALPAGLGVMLGPWANLQQWQRAAAIDRAGGSVRRAYAAAAALSFGLVVVAALVARSAMIPDGHGDTIRILGCALWFGIAVAATLDSFYLATREVLRAVTSESTSPLLAFLPAGLVATPLWYLASAIALAGLAIVEGAGTSVLSLTFATLFAGAIGCLICEVIAPRRRYDSVLCALIGIAATLILAMGLIGGSPALVALAPIVALVGALPAVQGCFERAMPAVTATAMPTGQNDRVTAAPTTMAVEESVLSHGFDGQWFLLHLVPTYDDTNSVGNVYFANYFRWIGKTRELFFNACMPDFDLRNTKFFVLTKSFNHEFRREIREFQPVTIRLKIGSYNRKFVTIVHEIHSRSEGLIGRGEQTIMFVDTVNYKPLDIPPVILTNFLPYYTPNTAGTKAVKASSVPLLS